MKIPSPDWRGYFLFCDMLIILHQLSLRAGAVLVEQNAFARAA